MTGARAAGLRAIWVDRDRKGWLDQLGGSAEELRPTRIVHSLEEVANVFAGEERVIEEKVAEEMAETVEVVAETES